MRFDRLAFVALASFAILVSACSSAKDKPEQEQSVDVLYNKASGALDKGDYQNATKNFEEVERQHPYSQWATQSQLMGAYSSYMGQRYDEAVVALDNFIELHPGNKDIDYAYYLKALCYYEQITDVRRDQAMTHDALEALDTLIRLYPDSKYSRDAQLKKDLTLDHLAGKEMEIGRYYLNQGQIEAAINRFMTVIRDYQTTTHAPEALHRLVECYLSLGLKDQAARVAAVLGYNYPGSKWYQRSFSLLDDKARQKILNDRGFLNKTMESIFKPA